MAVFVEVVAADISVVVEEAVRRLFLKRKTKKALAKKNPITFIGVPGRFVVVIAAVIVEDGVVGVHRNSW